MSYVIDALTKFSVLPLAASIKFPISFIYVKFFMFIIYPNFLALIHFQSILPYYMVCKMRYSSQRIMWPKYAIFFFFTILHSFSLTATLSRTSVFVTFSVVVISRITFSQPLAVFQISSLSTTFPRRIVVPVIYCS